MGENDVYFNNNNTISTNSRSNANQPPTGQDRRRTASQERRLEKHWSRNGSGQLRHNHNAPPHRQAAGPEDLDTDYSPFWQTAIKLAGLAWQAYSNPDSKNDTQARLDLLRKVYQIQRQHLSGLERELERMNPGFKRYHLQEGVVSYGKDRGGSKDILLSLLKFGAWAVKHREASGKRSEKWFSEGLKATHPVHCAFSDQCWREVKRLEHKLEGRHRIRRTRGCGDRGPEGNGGGRGDGGGDDVGHDNDDGSPAPIASSKDARPGGQGSCGDAPQRSSGAQGSAELAATGPGHHESAYLPSSPEADPRSTTDHVASARRSSRTSDHRHDSGVRNLADPAGIAHPPRVYSHLPPHRGPVPRANGNASVRDGSRTSSRQRSTGLEDTVKLAAAAQDRAIREVSNRRRYNGPLNPAAPESLSHSQHSATHLPPDVGPAQRYDTINDVERHGMDDDVATLAGYFNHQNERTLPLRPGPQRQPSAHSSRSAAQSLSAVYAHDTQSNRRSVNAFPDQDGTASDARSKGKAPARSSAHTDATVRPNNTTDITVAHQMRNAGQPQNIQHIEPATTQTSPKSHSAAKSSSRASSQHLGTAQPASMAPKVSSRTPTAIPHRSAALQARENRYSGRPDSVPQTMAEVVPTGSAGRQAPVNPRSLSSSRAGPRPPPSGAAGQVTHGPPSGRIWPHPSGRTAGQAPAPPGSTTPSRNQHATPASPAGFNIPPPPTSTPSTQQQQHTTYPVPPATTANPLPQAPTTAPSADAGSLGGYRRAKRPLTCHHAPRSGSDTTHASQRCDSVAFSCQIGPDGDVDKGHKCGGCRAL